MCDKLCSLVTAEMDKTVCKVFHRLIIGLRMRWDQNTGTRLCWNKTTVQADFHRCQKIQKQIVVRTGGAVNDVVVRV